MSIQKKVANSLAQEIIALGSSTQQTELTEDILEKMLIDIDISSALELMDESIVSRDWTIATDIIELEDKAQEVQTRFNNINMSKILKDMLKAVRYKRSIFNISYENMIISDLVLIPNKYITYDSASGWKIKTDKQEILISENEKDFLVCVNNQSLDNMEGSSGLAPLVKTFLTKESIDSKLNSIIEKYGDIITVFAYEAPLENATEEEKAVGEMFKAIASGVQNNEKSGLVLPKQTDFDSKQDMFRYSLLQTSGSRAYNTSDIIARYDRKILTALFADLLAMGQNSVGSFSLADAKSSILAMAIEFRLQEIKDVLDTHLIPLLYEVNGWDSSEGYPEFQFSDLDERDIEKFSSAVQRLAATGMIERDREIMNIVRETIGATPYPDDKPVDNDILTGGADTQSKTGKSFSTPSGGLNGTANSVSADDNSVSNLYNS